MNTSKIIKAYIGAGTYSTTEPITQGDYGYILQIEGTVLPATYRVDFSNNRHEGEALTVYGNEDGAEVPEELIATGKDIFAFYYYIGENFGKTAYTWKIPNDTRAKYGDRTPTPAQQDSIDQLIVRSNEAVTSAEQSASAAGQSAQSASDSAIEANRAELSAKSHALNAEQSSINADLSANDADASARAAAQSASQAEQIKTTVEGLAEDARDAANSSEVSARASNGFASQAQGFTRQAESYALGASGYASQASESAQTASTKASEASGYASTASQKATEASQSASQASGYAQTAEQAKTDAQTAQGLAESARDSAITAKTDAESARDEAQRIAETYDERLTNIDGLVFPQFELGNIQISANGWTYANSSLRIRTPQGYTVHLKEGSKISIAEGARFYCGALKSDDTYYDCGAWQTSELVLPVEGDYVICVTYLPQVTVTDVDALASMLTVYSIDNALEDIENINTRLTDVENTVESLEEDHYKPYVTDEASGAIATFDDGADDIPLKSLVVNIDPVQDLHGYDSPWVGGGGKNLLDPTLLKTQAAWNTINMQLKPSTAYTMSSNCPSTNGLMMYFTTDGLQPSNRRVSSGYPVTQTSDENGIIKVIQRRASGEESFSDYQFQVEEGSTATSWSPYENLCPITGWTGANIWADGKNLLDPTLLKDQVAWNIIKIYVPVGTRLIMSTNNTDVTSATGLPVYFLNEGDNQGSGTALSASHPVIKSVSSYGYVKVIQRNPSNTKKYSDYQWQVEILETGTEPTAYEPYQGQTIPINWQSEAGTVYGGKLDVLSGVLTVDRLGLDGGDLSWNKVDSYNYGNFYVLPTPLASYDTTRPTIISSSYKSESNQTASSTNDCYVWIRSVSSSNRRIYVKDTSKASMTAEEFGTAMTGVQFVYELAEPIEIQLTPNEVNSLLGQNNIFADTGDTSAEYRADTKLYISRLTEPDADMIADSNITSGKYFMVGNNLYKATANIASGASVIVGTNAIRKSLSEALNEINA